MIIKQLTHMTISTFAGFFCSALLCATASAEPFNQHFYGSLHVFAGQINDVSGVSFNSYASNIGNKGVNQLNDKWLFTHKIELELTTFNDALKGGGSRKLPSGISVSDASDKNTDVELRDAWIGIKPKDRTLNKVGEFRVGRHPSLYDIVDNGQNLLSKAGQALPSSGQLTEQLLYVNRVGRMAYSIAFAPFEDKSKDRVVSGLLNYSKDGYYAGLAFEKGSGQSTGAKFSVGLDNDVTNSLLTNYRLGLTYDKQMASAAKSVTLTGLIELDKYYMGVEYGKVLSGNVLNPDASVKFSEDTKNKAVEFGYQWNKSTRVYLDYANLGDRKETSLGIKYDF